MSRVVFLDMDGVVLNSNASICQAYRNAGVQPPEDVLGSEGQDWLLRQLCGDERAAELTRFRKDEFYRMSIRGGHVPLIAGWDAACDLVKLGFQVNLITGAAFEAIGALYRWIRMDRHGDWPFTYAIGKLQQRQKLQL